MRGRFFHRPVSSCACPSGDMRRPTRVFASPCPRLTQLLKHQQAVCLFRLTCWLLLDSHAAMFSSGTASALAWLFDLGLRPQCFLVVEVHAAPDSSGSRRQTGTPHRDAGEQGSGSTLGQTRRSDGSGGTDDGTHGWIGAGWSGAEASCVRGQSRFTEPKLKRDRQAGRERQGSDDRQRPCCSCACLRFLVMLCVLCLLASLRAAAV
jgi:hypothetical protein